jgi:hypothetical protein
LTGGLESWVGGWLRARGGSVRWTAQSFPLRLSISMLYLCVSSFVYGSANGGNPFMTTWASSTVAQRMPRGVAL